MPKLILIRGSKHYPHELDDAAVTVGSAPESDVVVAGDASVARAHCRVSPGSDQRWKLRSLSADRSTYLNEVPVRSAHLCSGDKIRVGQTVLLFVERASGRGEQSRLQNLLVLQEINKELNSETDLEALLELIMDMAIHLTEAERGFLVLVRGDHLSFKVARNIDARAVKSSEFKISNSVIRRVVKTGRPMLTSNAQEDLGSFQSIVDLEVRSLLCVPLRVKQRMLGTLYVDSRERAASFDEQDRELLTAFSDQAAIAIENARLLREATAAEAIRSELRVASRIQQALLPTKDPVVTGLEISGRMIPATEVGGDYYDYIYAPAERAPGGQEICFAIGDVSGKGVPAGLVMVMARSVLRSLAFSWEASPREILIEVNRILKPDLKSGMFMSMLFGRYHHARGALELCGCGHEPPLVYRAEGRDVQAYDAGGIVLGVMDDVSSVLQDMELKLGAGDAFVLYTDGVTEALDPQGAQYGLKRLMKMIQAEGHRPASELLEALIGDLRQHRGQAVQNDDMTLIVVRRTA